MYIIFLLSSFAYSNQQLVKNIASRYQYKTPISAETLQECPDDREYNHIVQEQSSYEPGNYYSCNLKFSSPIELSKGLLIIYNCSFSYLLSPKSAISIIANDDSVPLKSIEIQHCNFYRTSSGAIYIETKSTERAASILDCTFERCKSSTGTLAIYLKVASGNIERCKFINNQDTSGSNSGCDITYINEENGRLIIKENLFKRNGGNYNYRGNLIKFDSKSFFDFINNKISISIADETETVRLFDWPSEVNTLDNYKFEGNTMYPYNLNAISNTNDLLKDKFIEPEFECPPDYVEETEINNFCQSPFEEANSLAVDITSSLCNIIYCTFDTIKNYETNKGGAVYIYIDKDTQIYDEPIRIYNCDFIFCGSKFGSVFYIESYHDSLKFDFQDCYFGYNYYDKDDAISLKNELKGGVIYIKTKSSSFEIARCSFDENAAGDGGAIYYLAENTENEESNSNEFSLHLIDCRFHHNSAYSNGGAIYISIKGCEPLKPIQIESSFFAQSFANEMDEGGTEQPENGGAIYYSSSLTKLSDSTNNYCFRTLNCFFQTSIASLYGGAIYLLIKDEEPSKTIEISDCYFKGNQIQKYACNDKCDSGADIVFEFDSSSTSIREVSTITHILNINNCNFSNSKANYEGGSISIFIVNGEPSKSIEINKCIFKNCKAESDAAIYYNFASLSSLSTKGENIYSLDVVDCTFTSNSVPDKGAVIGIIIEKGEPSNPIEIKGCDFSNNQATGKDESSEDNLGIAGAIYYLSKSSTSTSSNNYKFSIYDSTFNANTAKNVGGSIYIEIANNEKSNNNNIEISRCSFNQGVATQFGGHIYYCFNSVSSSNSNSLLISDCEFTGSTAGLSSNGGSISISIKNGEPSKSIEINNCSFTSCAVTGIGGSIYYSFESSTNAKILLDEATEEKIYSLNIVDCKFTSNIANGNGGSIGLFITNKDPSNPIEIKGCSFNKNSALDNDENDVELGGAIYYLNQGSTTFSSNPALGIFDCSFDENQVVNFGGAISIRIVNCEPSNQIEIRNCSFDKNLVINSDNAAGASIYYEFKPNSMNTLENVVSLVVNECNFSEGSATEIYFNIANLVSSKTIEFNKCSFKDATSEGIYVYSESSSIFFHLNDCDFQSTSILYFCNEVHNVKLEDCRFNDMKNIPINYLSPSSPSSISETQEFRVENCVFTQNEEIECLVIFSSPLSSQFSFINNNITITNEKTRALGCKETVNLDKDKGWNFVENAINPGKEDYIKTSQAGNIPASCENGFICDEIPSESSDQSSDSSNEIESSDQIESSEKVESSDSSNVFESSDQEVESSEQSSDSSNEYESSESIESSESSENPPEPPQGCTELIRCDFNSSNTDGQNELANITDFHFKDHKYKENGAAIHIYNCFFYCKDSTFTNCSSEGGGGAIYIYLDTIVESPIKLEDLEFTKCNAIYGGAVFAYSEISENEIDVIRCKFSQNAANKKPSNNGDVYYGGAAIYMASMNGNILNCSFYKNSGSGVKIFNDFSKLKESKKFLKSFSSLSISGCIFEASNEPDSSSFVYVRGKKMEIPVDVRDCVFMGEIADGSYHIDGESLNEKKDPLNLHIKSCKFLVENEKQENVKKSELLLRSFEDIEKKMNEKDIENYTTNAKNDIRMISFFVVGISCAAVISALFIHFSALKKIHQISDEENIEL